MANKKIAGITVEIGGDTTKLGKALSDVDKQSRNLKNELKEVDKALKLDPKNTELLTQKQQILADAIQNSKKKLDTLKNAQEQVTAQYQRGEIDDGKFRAFQREVETAKSELSYFEDEAKKAKSETDNLSGKLSTVKDDFKKAGENIEKAGDKVTAFGEGIEKAGDKALIASGIIAGAAAASYKAWEKTDEGYDTIVTKTGATGKALEELKDVADSVFTSLPTDMNKVGVAVGEINTRFGSTGDELEALTQKFIKYSEINDSDVNGSIDNVSASLKAFGLGSESAGDLLDKLTSIAQRTGIPISQLESSLMNNADTFKALGYNISDAAELLGQFEINGVNSSTALASMKKTIGSLIAAEGNAANAQGKSAEEYEKAQKQYKKTSDALEVLKQKQKEYTDKTKESQKLADTKKIEQYEAELESLSKKMSNLKAENSEGFFIEDFGNEFDKYIDKIKNAESETDAIEIAAELFGTKGAAAMAKSIREGRADFTKFNSTLGDTAGLVDSTFEATLDAPDKLKVAMNNVKLSASGLAETAMSMLAPALQRIVDKIKALTERFNNLDDSTKKTIIKIAGVAAAIGPVLILIGKLTSGVGGLISSVGSLFKLAAANPWVFAIGAVVAALAVLYVKNEEFRNFVNETAKEFAEFFSEMAQEVKQWYTDNKPLIDDIIKVLKYLAEVLIQYCMKAAKETMNGFKLAWSVISATWNVVTSYFRTIGENIKLIFSAVKKALTGDFSGAWEDIKQIFSNTGEFFSGVGESIKSVFSGVGTFIIGKFRAARDFIKGAFSGLGEFFGATKNEMVEAFESVPEALEEIFRKALAKIKGVAGEIGDTVSSVVDKIPGVSLVKSGVSKLKGFFAGGGELTRNGEAAVVGEAGPELLQLLNGKAVVTPLGGGSQPKPTVAENAQTAPNRTVVHQTYNIYVKEFASPQDARTTSQELAKLQRQTEFGKGIVTV